MEAFFQNVLTASIHGSIVILAVLILRLALRKAPRKLICYLWSLAGLRLLIPVPLQSRFSLQPIRVSLPASLSVPRLALIVWVAIAVVIASYSALSYIHLRRRVADAVKIPGGWESDRIETAFVLGFVRPKIYIPTGMSEENRKQILAHERTHLDKGDHWIKVIGFAALVLHWFNPLVWLAYILLCKDIEMACDERVIQFMELDERKAYATALLQCSTDHVHYAACPVAFGEVSVKHRIKSALNYKKPGFWISLLGVIAIAFVAVCLLTTPPEKVEVVVDQQDKLQESSRQDPASFPLADIPVTDPNPDWGITFLFRNETCTGGTLVYAVEERFAAQSQGMSFSDTRLERRNETGWESLGPVQPEVKGVGFAQLRSNPVEYNESAVNWEARYGSLEAGDYRIVQTISSDTESAVFYAPFHIYREALPAEEEAALSRCESALEKMKTVEYEAVLSETNREGNLSPTRGIVKMNGKTRVDYYLGEYVTSSAMGTDAVYAAKDWDMPFRLNQNRRFLFPEGQSVISQQEIRFSSVWRDYTGTACRGTDSYRFDENGNLQSVNRMTEQMDENGNVTQSSEIHMEVDYHRYGSEGYKYEDMTKYEPEDSELAQEKSPWGIFFRVDDDLLTPGGGEVWLGTNAIGVSHYTTDGSYWLEKRVDDHWERLGSGKREASWGEETITLKSDTRILNVDWTDAYGKLEPGDYRMGKHFYNGTETTIQYAEFTIYPTGGIYGEGGEAAMARLKAAMDKLENGPYRIEEWERSCSEYDPHEYLTNVYWHLGDTAVTDYYQQETLSHSIVEKAGDELYCSWLDLLHFDEENDCVYFPEGDSVISDYEISFGAGTTRSSGEPNRYSFYFDKEGNISEIVTHIYKWNTRYIVMDTSEEEIQNWITQKQAEQ